MMMISKRALHAVLNWNSEEETEGNVAIVDEIKLSPFDIGTLCGSPTKNQLENMIRAVPVPLPKQLPRDADGQQFPLSVLFCSHENGEKSERKWLVFSPSKEALYCLPCRLFSHSIKKPTQSTLATASGWDKNAKWKKLWARVPKHERSSPHRECYLSWRELQTRLLMNTGVDVMVEERVLSEIEQWKKLLSRIIDVTIFLGERGLAFRGSSLRIGDVHDGNFLGILELLAHYDPLLQEHISKVKTSQPDGKRLQAHYLSPQSQNEFIKVCAARVRGCILKERENTKYFSIMVDGTPDSSHTEQTTFILRYMNREGDEYSVKERFLVFVDCCNKTGMEIASLILETLEKYDIPINDCQGQGYDNAANMSGKYNGAQTRIRSMNSLSLYSPCACHSLNLCGNDSAMSCKEAVTFFEWYKLLQSLLLQPSAMEDFAKQRWLLVAWFFRNMVERSCGKCAPVCCSSSKYQSCTPATPCTKADTQEDNN